MPGQTIYETVNGQHHPYATVQPCTHDFWNDDPGYDPYYDDALASDHPKAVAAQAKGVEQGRAELAELRARPTTQRPQEVAS